MDHHYSISYEDITLTPLQDENLELLRILRNKKRLYFINSFEISIEQQKKWYIQYKQKNDDLMFVISNETNKFLGAIGLYNIDYINKTAEFGRVVVEDYSPKYTGTKAIKAIIFFSKFNLCLKSIVCSVLKENAKAINIYSSLGFKLYKQDHKLYYYSLNLE